MKRNRTRENYGERITRVIRYIHDHLDDGLTSERLAEIACFSPFHFHRIYHGMTGETVTDTVRRLRLMRAGTELVDHGLPIDAAARRAGYGSAQAFTRAFRELYGVPPAAFRSDRRTFQAKLKNQPKGTNMYKVDIKTLPPVRLAVLRHSGSYMAIGKTFEQLYALAAAENLLRAQTRGIGVYYDDPAETPEDALRSVAGISIDSTMAPSDKLEVIELAGGRHAVARHKGPYSDLHSVYTWLFGTWLPQSGEEAADRPPFEDYLNNPRDVPPTELLTDIYLPLQ